MSDEAIVLLDENGRIEFANATLGRWWNVNIAALIGDSFANLFEFEVISTDQEWQQTQWMALRDTATEGPVVLTIHARSGPPLDITLRLERTTEGDKVRYLAYIRKSNVGDKEEAANVAARGGNTDFGSEPSADGSERGTSMFGILEADSDVGFFDFDYLASRYNSSPKWFAILGHSPEGLALSGSIWRELVHEEDSAAAPDAPSRKHAGQRRPFSIDFRIRKRDSSYLWVNCTGVQVLGREGNVERVAGMMTDIQERKDFEEQCLAAEERLERMGQVPGVALFDVDFEAGSAWYSPGLAKVFGYRDGEFDPLPESLGKLLPKGAGEVRAWIAAHKSGESVVAFPSQLTRADGTTIAVDVQVIRTFDRRKNLLRASGFILPSGSDEPRPLGMPTRHVGTAFDAIVEGVIVTDSKGSILFLNSKACQLLHCDRAEAIGKPASSVLKLLHRITLAPAVDPITQVIESAEPVPINDSFSIPGAQEADMPHRIVFSCDPVPKDDGAVAGTVFVFRNPDELTLTPDELVRSNRFESLGMLAGGIAHDFNNLLTTILGGISLAREAGDFSQLEDSEKGCMTAKGLTRQLLSLARGGADMRQILNPAEVISEAVRLAAVGTHVKVNLELAEGLHVIHADRNEIVRVFQNLVINSIQAIEGPGSVTISASNVELNADDVPPLHGGDYVQIQVTDTGCGIPSEQLQSIFEPFFTTKKTGTGLGLATVLSIIKTHGGQVGVDSTVGKGTTFTIFLPRADQPVAEIQREAPTLRFGSGRIL
ncbi:MAG TPA: ATP-binding protein, partial [Opitutaceae bacterium]|nr:ATP-binding protein [Opitutaceae bacterium]